MKSLRSIFPLLPLVALLFLGSCKKEAAVVDYSAVDKKIIQEYISKHGLDADSTSSGLYYVIDNPGIGLTPNKYSYVKARYKGYLTTGAIFDQNTTGATFGLQNVIAGWQEGIPKFKEGGSGKLLIPSHLGYGDRATSGIPANSVLIFDINLDEVVQ